MKNDHLIPIMIRDMLEKYSTLKDGDNEKMMMESKFLAIKEAIDKTLKVKK